MLHHRRKTGGIHRRLTAKPRRQAQASTRASRYPQPNQHVIDRHTIVFQRHHRCHAGRADDSVPRRLLRQWTQRLHQQHIPVHHPFTGVRSTHPNRARPLGTLLALTQNRHIHRITERSSAGDRSTNCRLRLHRKLPGTRHIPHDSQRRL